MTQTSKIDTSLVERFMTEFFGYGNLDAPYWFIGMEEGGGNSFEEIRNRLASWQALGGNTVADLAEFHARISETRWFGSDAKIQRTWSALIRILMSCKGEAVGTETVREYQRSLLGRHGQETALLELFPLPSPSTNHWLYRTLTDLPELQSRDSYYTSLEEHRIRSIRELVRTHTPEMVVCYGFGHLERWLRLIPTDMQEVKIGKSKAWFGQEGSTKYVICAHPVAHGLTKDYWQTIGLQIRARIN